MKTTLFAVMLTLLLAAACLVDAYPTLAGPTGYGVLPNAAIAPANQLNVALDYRTTLSDVMEIRDVLVPGIKDAFPVRALYGADQRTEIGVAYNLTKAAGDTANTWSVNAKYLTPFTCCGFSWATGVLFASTDVKGVDEKLKTADLYLVGTRNFTISPALSHVNGSVGLRWTRVKDGGTTSGFRLFAGAGATLGEKLNLSAEITTKQHRLDVNNLYALTVRYPFSTAVTGEIGYTNADPFLAVTGTDVGKIFLGINVTANLGAQK